MVSPLEEDGIKEAIHGDNNTIISDLTLRNNLTIQLKKITAQYKVMDGCECRISNKSMHY